MGTSQLTIDVTNRNKDLVALLGKGDPLSSRDFHTGILQQIISEYNLPALTVHGESNWWETTFGCYLASDVGYRLVFDGLGIENSAALENSKQRLIVYTENLARNDALRVVNLIREIRLMGVLHLLDPADVSGEMARGYQQPLGRLTFHEQFAANLVVGSLLYGTTIAGAEKIRQDTRHGDWNLPVSINDMDGLVMAVHNPTAERVNAAVDEFRRVGECLVEHQAVLQQAIAVLEPAYSCTYNKSRPDIRPRIYAVADRLLQNIEKPHLDILAAPKV